MRDDSKVAELDDRRLFGREIHNRGPIRSSQGSGFFSLGKPASASSACAGRLFRSLHPVEGGLASPQDSVEQSAVSSAGVLDRGRAAERTRKSPFLKSPKALAGR